MPDLQQLYNSQRLDGPKQNPSGANMRGHMYWIRSRRCRGRIKQELTGQHEQSERGGRKTRRSPDRWTAVKTGRKSWAICRGGLGCSWRRRSRWKRCRCARLRTSVGFQGEWGAILWFMSSSPRPQEGWEGDEIGSSGGGGGLHLGERKWKGRRRFG